MESETDNLLAWEIPLVIETINVHIRACGLEGGQQFYERENQFAKVNFPLSHFLSLDRKHFGLPETTEEILDLHRKNEDVELVCSVFH